MHYCYSYKESSKSTKCNIMLNQTVLMYDVDVDDDCVDDDVGV